MPVDPSAVERLIDLGRRQGFVTTAQIDRELPVERLSEVEIAEIVDRLERAGVPVELDEGLSTERATAGPTDGGGGGPVIRLQDDGPRPSAPRPPPSPDLAPSGRLPGRGDEEDRTGTGLRGVGWGVAAFAATAVVVAVVVFLLAAA